MGVLVLKGLVEVERNHFSPKVKGGDREELPHVQGQGRHPRRATPHLRSGAAAERSNTTSKKWRLHRHRRPKRSYSMFKVRRGNLVQGKEQRLCFAGAGVKRYPMSKVRETQVRQ